MYNSNCKLKVCFLGTYERNYPGNAVLIEGLRRNGVKVIECWFPLWKNIKGGRSETYKTLYLKIILLFRYIIGIIAFSIKYLFTVNTPCTDCYY